MGTCPDSPSLSSLVAPSPRLVVYPKFNNITSKGSVFIRRWLSLATWANSLSGTPSLFSPPPPSARGLHKRTTGSIPLVANKQTLGWGCKQLTMESSPFIILSKFVEFFSHKKNEPSSLPATMYSPSAPKKFASLMSVVVLQWPQNLAL